MAEEQRWQEPGGSHRPCANNCGFFGSPTTLHLCSKCYKDLCTKEQHAKDAHAALEITTIPQSEPSIPPASVLPPTTDPILLQTESAPPVGSEAPQLSADSNSSLLAPQASVGSKSSAAATRPNRCGACRKRVGLTGFACRCGVTFCGLHRYPEKHGCGFDYKAMGREAIAKANPVIKGEKLNKI